MNIFRFVLLFEIAAACFSIRSNTTYNQITRANNMTNWNIEPSFKYDALCFINILTADTFYLTYYQKEYDRFKPLIVPEAENSLKNLKKALKDENGRIISAYLCLYFSAVDDSTLAQMLSTLDDTKKLKENFDKTPYSDEDSWKLFESVKDDLKTAVRFLQEINFEGYWKDNILPVVEQKIAEIGPDLPKYDVIKENEEFLGYKLPSNDITVYMLYYSQPHGIKITGNRFLTDAAWPFKIVIRTAAHEMMHPPYDFNNNTRLRNAIELLGKDDFLMDKVKNHNPSFGYNTLEGLMEEDCVQALDQMINEKLDIARDARERWKTNDDGIHVFAVALYQVMKDESYNTKQEVFSDFLTRMIETGRLGPGTIKAWHDKFYSKK